MPQSGRVLTLVSVSQGSVFVAKSGDPAWTATVNATTNTPPLISTGVVRSTVHNGKLYFADGVHYCYYNPMTNTVYPWNATAGTIPSDGANTPQLIQTWRGRIVVAGVIGSPQDWFMSAVDDPLDWDYSPLSVTPTQAVAGLSAPQGLVGDMITSIIPYNDDVLYLGGDHSLWMFRGDPMAGGQLDRVSDIVGMAWGIPWCKDPSGNLYFVSNRLGIYMVTPGQAPQRISQPIDGDILNVDTGANIIRLLWDDRLQGIHFFITDATSSTDTSHLFLETANGAWWTDIFGESDHNPLCCCVFDGDNPSDRVGLIGSWDGYVRGVSHTATTDDGTPIDSEVVIGPLLTKTFDEIILKELQARLGADSSSVVWAIHVGASAEEALASDAVLTGTWNQGWNYTDWINWAGHAIYVRITCSNPWAMEAIRASIMPLGKVRMRSR